MHKSRDIKVSCGGKVYNVTLGGRNPMLLNVTRNGMNDCLDDIQYKDFSCYGLNDQLDVTWGGINLISLNVSYNTGCYSGYHEKGTGKSYVKQKLLDVKVLAWNENGKEGTFMNEAKWTKANS